MNYIKLYELLEKVKSGHIDIGKARDKILDSYKHKKEGQKTPIDRVSVSFPDYEYEMFIEDDGAPFVIHSWIPIATDRIKDITRIDEYIKKGLIRKITES